MNRKTFTERMKTETMGVKLSPEMKMRMSRAMRKETKQEMKRSVSWAMVAVVTAMMLCGVAVATSGHGGILDFVRRPDAYVTDDVGTYVHTNLGEMENGAVIAQIREAYYDGRVSRLVLDIAPKSEKTLLLGLDVSMNDRINNWRRYAQEDARTIAQVCEDEAYQQVLHVQIAVDDLKDEQGDAGQSTSMDAVLNEDGTLTWYVQTEYETDGLEREMQVRVATVPYASPFTEDVQMEEDKKLEAVYALSLTATQETKNTTGVYVNTEPIAFESVGVQVDSLRVEVKPQELWVTLVYTVTNKDAYAKQDGGLWFEFIDPNSTSDVYAEQRLKAGLTGTGAIREAAPGQYVQEETLGRNELHDVYTLRAFNVWEKERYEQHEMRMKADQGE